MRDYKVVVIGGGTGLSSILRGLKRFPLDITAIVTVADDGSSSGALRGNFEMPPPGDVRNVLVSLSEVEPLVEELFQYRFQNGEGLTGHPVGNLLITAMTKITGNFATAIDGLSQILNVKGRVLPVCNEPLVLCAEYEDGTTAKGESDIPQRDKKIKKVYYEDKSSGVLKEAVRAVQEADLVVLAPGSLYTSIIPNLLFDEMKEAIINSKAPRVYCCNIMSQPGETTGFTVSDHIEAIEEHVGHAFIDTVLVNDAQVTPFILAKYELDGAHPIEIDEEELESQGIEVVQTRMIAYTEDDQIRHDARKVAAMIFSLLLEI